MLRNDVELCEIRTDLGVIGVCLFVSRAPTTTCAFLAAVDADAYSGGQFFRAVRPDNDCAVPPIEIVQAVAKKTAHTRIGVAHELTSVTGVRHVGGALSLPRGSGLASARSFFFCIRSQPHLDARGARHPDGQGFAAFGRVHEGMEIVDCIAKLETRYDPSSSHPMKGQLIDTPPLIHEIRPINVASREIDFGDE